MFKQFINFYSPEDSESITEELLEPDPEETEVIDLKEEKKEDEVSESDDKELDDNPESKDELDEIEEELEEEEKELDDEELELVSPVRRKEILAKYPSLFKDFPDLEKSYYRERQYTELLPTIKEAKEAAEAKQFWDTLDSELQEGNLENILTSLHQVNKNSFYKVADNFLETVEKINPQVSEHIYAGVIKQAIQIMAESEEYKEVATKVYKYFFPNKGWEAHKPLASKSEPDPRESELNKKQRAFVQQQFKTAATDISGRVENTIKATIERNIDPKNSMSAYVKENAIRDTLASVKEQMNSDTRFQKILNKLWQDSASKDFSQESKDRIRNAIITRAKQLLVPAIKKSRQTALAGSVKKERKAPVTKVQGTTTAPSKSGNVDKEKYKGMSTYDILNS